MVVTVFCTFIRQHQHKRCIPAAMFPGGFSDSRCRELLELDVPDDKKLDVLLIADKIAEKELQAFLNRQRVRKLPMTKECDGVCIHADLPHY